ncbi:MAG: c-type cytochrome [Saprospiraceae bacterium]|nr:c-type cytochrome [Saprospiraceae bacterium]
MLRIRINSSFLLILLTGFILQAAPSIESGKTLFKNNCASCHNKNMKDKLTGPALGGVQDRWAAYPKEDLVKWIQNSQSLIAAGHPEATKLWAEWKPTQMQAFPSLTDENVESILMYIDCTFKGTCGGASVAVVPGANAAGSKNEGISPIWIYVAFGILLMLALFLWNVMSDMSYTRKLALGEKNAVRQSIWDKLSSKGVISLVLFGLILFGGYTTVNNAISLGRQQNYAPDQPIKFSHEIHAGVNKIDCNYCHDGARRSKQSIIPGASTCMNCHTAVKKGTQTGTSEITKIYTSIGFNPITGKYIENYDQLEASDIEKIFKKWIEFNYKEDNELKELSNEAQTIVDNQWKDIVSSMTGPNKPKIQGPIEWIRIHNLPDHVYFNHSQHVTVGKIACQKCHGNVEEMATVRQYAPLSMGWCINCHRQTDVKFADNKYYDSYKIYHDELKAGTRTSVKVADIGGLECQKCHY